MHVNSSESDLEKGSLPGIKKFLELPQSTHPKETVHSYRNYLPPFCLQARNHQNPGEFFLCQSTPLDISIVYTHNTPRRVIHIYFVPSNAT